MMGRGEAFVSSTDSEGEPRDSVSLYGDVQDLKHVLNHLQSGVVAHAADTSIRVCNPRACSILGLTMDQMIGVSAPDPQWMFVREDGSPMPLEEYPVSLVFRTRERFEDLLVGVNRPAQGDLVWALCNGYPVLDAEGELQLAIITFIDVTEQRRAEAERERLEGQLRQATKMEAIGRLAGGVAHDFNNILTGILGYAEMLDLVLPEGHAGREYAAEIRNGGERAADLTGQLLAFARKQVIEPRIIRPNVVIQRSEKLLRRVIGEDVRLRFVAGEGVWNIKADPTQLDQVLLNLAVNARDAMPSGGRLTMETANVVLEDEQHIRGGEPVSGEFVLLAVSDDGEGMDPETVDRIFEPFFSTKGPGKGTGLGLATVYGIIEQNDGVITVYSEPGHGTTFKLYFPAVREDADVTQKRPPVSVEQGVETILLVEDDPTVRELTRKVLSSQGYTVLEAEHAEEALLLNRRFSGTIDLLVSDVVMPGLNGRELYERLKVLRPKLRALFISGYTENVIAHHGVLEEGTHFLQKPFTLDGLLRRVRELLG
jgi:two-component system cell cycle sensor histidine kinase/response regulator CckA